MNKIKHYKNNKKDIDYIETKDVYLKEVEYKGLLNIKVKENETLKEYLNKLEADIELLKEKLEKQELLYQEQQDFLKKLEKGLNLRWKERYWIYL